MAVAAAIAVSGGCAPESESEQTEQKEITGRVNIGDETEKTSSTPAITDEYDIIIDDTTTEATTVTAATTTADTALPIDQADVSAAETLPSAYEVSSYYETQFPVTPDKDYTLSDADNAFIDKCAFVGDSVFYGLFSYGFIDSERVFANAGVAARNLFDFEFRGQDIKSAVKSIDPEYVVFYMGMNDLNMTDIDTYVQNYLNLMAQFSEYKLMVVSVTPVNRDSWFTYNWKIDAYNNGIKNAITSLGSDRVCYIDVNSALKNASGDVRTEYDGGDGVHLNKAGYPALLWHITNMNPWGGTTAATGTSEPAETPALTAAETTTSPDLTTNDAILPEEDEAETETSPETEPEPLPETEATEEITEFVDVSGDNDDVDVLFD
jgi:lysophospholipase L1-like esterase